MAPIDVVQAQAEAGDPRQTARATPQATLRNNELALKRLIVSGTDDELWRATLIPSTDLPTIAAEPLDLEGGGRANALADAPTSSTPRRISRSATSTCATW